MPSCEKFTAVYSIMVWNVSFWHFLLLLVLLCQKITGTTRYFSIFATLWNTQRKTVTLAIYYTYVIGAKGSRTPDLSIAKVNKEPYVIVCKVLRVKDLHDCQRLATLSL